MQHTIDMFSSCFGRTALSNERQTPRVYARASMFGSALSPFLHQSLGGRCHYMSSSDRLNHTMCQMMFTSTRVTRFEPLYFNSYHPATIN